MGDVVILRSIPIDLNSDVGCQFVVDCTRAGEGLLTDKELQEKYELSPVDWRNITKDAVLGRAIRAERDRRVLNGTAAREAAAKHFVKAPGILDGIMSNAYENTRLKIEAIKELRQVAIGDSADRPAEAGQFVIRIDLTAGGGDVETYSKVIKLDASDTNGNSTSASPLPLEEKPDGHE